MGKHRADNANPTTGRPAGKSTAQHNADTLQTRRSVFTRHTAKAIEQIAGSDLPPRDAGIK
jgi:hypothetical protein